MKLVKGKQADSFRAININHTNTSLLKYKNRSSDIIALVFLFVKRAIFTLLVFRKNETRPE